MKKTRIIGFGFWVLAVLTVLVGKFTNIMPYLAKKSCGDMYMVEPDPLLAQQGILSDAACGFDIDMQMVAVVFMLLLWGIVFLIISLFTKKKMKKINVSVLASFGVGVICGGIIASFVLWYQIANRYTIGMNNGYLTGKSDCVSFMQAHLESDEIPASFGVKVTAVPPQLRLTA